MIERFDHKKRPAPNTRLEVFKELGVCNSGARNGSAALTIAAGFDDDIDHFSGDGNFENFGVGMKK